jgi:hypothetical protein
MHVSLYVRDGVFVVPARPLQKKEERAAKKKETSMRTRRHRSNLGHQPKQEERVVESPRVRISTRKPPAKRRCQGNKENNRTKKEKKKESNVEYQLVRISTRRPPAKRRCRETNEEQKKKI